MRYCPHHQRALRPTGYGPADAAYLPAAWCPCLPHVVALAYSAAAMFPAQVTITHTPCDLCCSDEGSTADDQEV